MAPWLSAESACRVVSGDDSTWATANTTTKMPRTRSFAVSMANILSCPALIGAAASRMNPEISHPTDQPSRARCQSPGTGRGTAQGPLWLRRRWEQGDLDGGRPVGDQVEAML